MASIPVYNTGGSTTSPNRAPAAKVIAGALANNRVAQALISALGTYSLNAITATHASATTDFGSLRVGDLVLHVGTASGPSQLGIAATYSAIAYSAITGSTGAGSTLNGNIGLYPTTAASITNFPPSTLTGVENAANASAASAIAAAQAAYTAFNLMPATAIGHSELNGITLVPGVYSNGATTLNGTLTFNGAGTYIIQVSSTLNTGASGTPIMLLTNGATANNIYWTVAAAATLNSANPGTFQGSVIAEAAITVSVGPGTIEGTLASLTAAVTYSGTTTSVAAANTPGNSSGGVSFSTIAVAGNLGYTATVGDLYLDLQLINLDANNPLVPPPPAQLTGRVTGDGGLEF